MAEKPEERRPAGPDCNWTAERKAKLDENRREREREREGGGEARVKRDALAPPASLRFSLGGLP